MKFISSTLALLFAIAPVAVQSHTTQIQYCVTSSFYLRVFVEHWHGAMTEESEAAISTIDITETSSGTPTQAAATGILNGVALADLAAAGDCEDGTLQMVSSCSDQGPQNNWLFFDLAMTECETPVSFTFDNPSDYLFEDACSANFPSEVSGDGFPCPDFDISNNQVVSTLGLSEAEQLAIRWTMSEPIITFDSDENTVTADYMDASGIQIDMQEEFYDVNCKDDGSGFPEYVIRDYFSDPSDPYKKPKMMINTSTGRPELKMEIDVGAMANDRRIFEIVGEVTDSCMGQYYDLTATIAVNPANADLVDSYHTAGDSFPFSFNVVRKDSGDTVYTTGDIPVSFDTGMLPVAFGEYTVTKRIQNLCRATDYDFVFTQEEGNNDFSPTVTVSYDSPGTRHWFNKNVFEWSDDQPLPNPNLADSPDDIMFQKSISTTEYSFTEEMNLPLNPSNPITDLTGKEGKGMMRFCLRSGVGYNKPDSTYNMDDSLLSLAHVIANGYQEVNFFESLITIFFDLSAGIEMEELLAGPKERVETTAVKEAYGLEAWLCESGSADADYETKTWGRTAPIAISDNYLVDETNPNPEYFNQGALITVCVAPVESAFADGIRMDGIIDFEWLRDDLAQTFTNNANNLPVTDIKQPAIVEGEPSANLLTSYIASDCIGGPHYCRFSSILFADFYITTGAVSGSGNSRLTFGAPGSRRLGESASRQLQADEGGESPFDLSVPVTITDTGPAGLKTAAGVSFAAGTFTMSVALIGAALLA